MATHVEAELVAGVVELVQHRGRLARQGRGCGWRRRRGGRLRHEDGLLRGLVGAETLEDRGAQVAGRGDLGVLDLDYQLGADIGGSRGFGGCFWEGGGGGGEGIERRTEFPEQRVAEAATGTAPVDQGAVGVAGAEQERAEGGLAGALAGGETGHDELGGAAVLDLGPRVRTLAG